MADEELAGGSLVIHHALRISGGLVRAVERCIES